MAEPNEIGPCNETCCWLPSNRTMCFADYNFTDRYDLTYPPNWEIGVRWTICIPLVLMGVCGNFLTIFLLLKNKLLMQTSINLFILNMAVADLIHSIVGPIPYTIEQLHQFWILGKTWCFGETYIEELVTLVSMTSIAVISFDRMLGIVRPFHRHLKHWQSLLIISIIWIYAAVLSTPFAIYKNYLKHKWADIDEILCTERCQSLHIWRDIINIGSFWIPLTTMSICYSIIFYNFKKYTRTKQEHPASVHMKHRVLRMLVLLTLLVIFMWVPNQAFEIARWYLTDDKCNFEDDTTKEVYNIMLPISKYLMFVLPAVNPIVYVHMHQNFRRAYRTTFTCCFKENPKFFLTSGVDGNRPFMWSLRTSASAFVSSVRRKSSSLHGRIDIHLESLSKGNNSYGNTLTIPGQEANIDTNITNCASSTISDIHLESLSKGNNNYGNTLTIPGQEANIDTNITNCASSTISEPEYPQQINNNENKSTLNGRCLHDNEDGNITKYIPSEAIFLVNNDHKCKPILSSQETGFDKQSMMNSEASSCNAALETHIQTITDNDNSQETGFDKQSMMNSEISVISSDTPVKANIQSITVSDHGHVNTLDVLSDEPSIHDLSDSSGL